MKYRDKSGNEFTKRAVEWVKVEGENRVDHSNWQNPISSIPHNPVTDILDTKRVSTKTSSSATINDIEFPEELMERYSEVKFIGKGGFAHVFKAKRKDGKVVAVKVPNKSEEAGKSFILELSNWRKLKYEYIAELYDFNIHPYPHIEMELCDGTLYDVRLNFNDILWIIYRVSKALEYAHSKGIAHGDLKPSNVLIKRVGNEIVPKLADWGSGFTPEYASPELLENESKPNEKSDIWSFGVMTYELLTGKNPFAGEDFIDTVLNIKNKEFKPKPLNNVPLELNNIIMKCLNRNPNERYESFSELCKDLSNFLKGVINESITRTFTQHSKSEFTRYSLQYSYMYVLQSDLKRAEDKISKLKILVEKRFVSVLNSLRIVMDILQECYKSEANTKDILVKYDSVREYLPKNLRDEIEKDECLGELMRKLKCYDIKTLDEDMRDEIKRFCYRFYEKVLSWACYNDIT